MRHIPFSYLLAILTVLMHCTKLAGQECGTQLTEPIPKWYLESLAILPRGDETDTVGLAVFVIRDTQNTENLLMDFTASLDWINIIYKEAGLYFFVCSWIEEDGGSTFSEPELDLIHTDRYMDHRLHIYLVQRLKYNGFDIAGFANFPWIGDREDRYLAIIQKEVRYPQLLAHEIGHFYGLLHTHDHMHGFELVDRSNCKTAGDQCCDTPADPFLGFHNMSGCFYIGNEVDLVGRPYLPLTHFIMSYAPYNCIDRFSNEQFTRMRQTAQNEYNDMVNNCSDLPDIALMTNYEPISLSFVDTLTIPLEISHTLQDDTYSDITVYLQDELSEDEIIIHTETLLLTPDSPTSSLIIHVALPLGVTEGIRQLRVKVDGARQIIEDNERNNESSLTFIMDNSRFEDGLIFPNPVDDILTLFYRNSNASGGLIMEIIDIQGRILMTHMNDTWNVTFYDRIGVSSLTDGMYFLRLRYSNDGTSKIFPFVKE